MTQPTTTISQRPNAAPLTGGEFLPMDQGDSTVKATAQQVANLAPGTNITYDPASRTLVSSTGDDVTLPLVSETAAGLVPDGWITGAIPAPLPHIHGALAGVVYEHVRNVSGAPMAALTPYHVVDSQGATDRVDIIPANASDPTSMPASGILMAALGASGSAADGHGVVAGVPTGVDTAANPSGTVLYVGNGVLTPTAPAANVQALAIVGRSHATTGTLSMIGGASLARVAYTGVYGDLAGRPTIPTPADQAPAALGTAAIGTSPDYAREDHVHQMPTAANVGADPAGTAASSMSAHLSASDPHTQYLRVSELVAGSNVNLDTTTTPGSVIINSTATSTGGTPGGSSGQAQFNNNGAFGGAAGLTIDPTTGRLRIASFLASASAPATPASAGFVLYAAPTSGALGWVGGNGFSRQFNATGNTADRVYQLQDKSGTIAHLDDVFNGYAVGNYIMPVDTTIGSGTSLLNASLIYLYPFVLKRSAQINELGARVNTAIASSVFQLAVYDNNAGLPGTVLASTVDISGASATALSSSVAPITLRAGTIYWFAVNSSIAGIVFQAPLNAATHANSIIGNNSLTNVSSAATTTAWNRTFTQAYGTWPDLTGQATTLSAVSRAPSPILRVSALL